MVCFFPPVIKILYMATSILVHLLKSITFSLVSSVSCFYWPFTYLHRNTWAVFQLTIKICISSFSLLTLQCHVLSDFRKNGWGCASLAVPRKSLTVQFVIISFILSSLTLPHCLILRDLGNRDLTAFEVRAVTHLLNFKTSHLMFWKSKKGSGWLPGQKSWRLGGMNPGPGPGFQIS